jgi:hypothetical protein
MNRLWGVAVQQFKKVVNHQRLAVVQLAMVLGAVY